MTCWDLLSAEHLGEDVYDHRACSFVVQFISTIFSIGSFSGRWNESELMFSCSKSAPGVQDREKDSMETSGKDGQRQGSNVKMDGLSQLLQTTEGMRVPQREASTTLPVCCVVGVAKVAHLRGEDGDVFCVLQLLETESIVSAARFVSYPHVVLCAR